MAELENTKMVAIVDDDDLMRSALQGLLKAVGLPAQAFASAEEFLKSGQQRQAGCLIADIRMPGMSGLELQAHLNAERCKIPIIFSSPCAVIKMIGILQRSAFRCACSSRPDIPGIRISAIKQPAWRCWPDFRNSSADANACAGKPTDFSRPCNALRIKSSSSTIATIFDFSREVIAAI